MGTHPIFESDFDCLTEWQVANCIPIRITSAPTRSEQWLTSLDTTSRSLRNTFMELRTRLRSSSPSFSERCPPSKAAKRVCATTLPSRTSSETHRPEAVTVPTMSFAGLVSPKVTFFLPLRNGSGRHLELCSQTRIT